MNRDILIDRRVGIINAGKDRHLVIALREPLPVVPKEGFPGKQRGPPNVSNHEKRVKALEAERKKAAREAKKLGGGGLDIPRLSEDLVDAPTWTTPLDRIAEVRETATLENLIQVLDDAVRERGSGKAE